MTDSIGKLTAALADRYRIERELGAGGMATVYLAEDLRHHRKVAVKVLRQDVAATLGAERFVREIQVAAQLHHPHILPLYDSGQADEFLFYVMPFEQGQSLRERLNKETELPIPDVVRLLHDVADALAHAHQHGLVHRDIKPENVLLSGRHALVTDFGVAKAVSEATGREQLTTVGVALGTPTYMAPEQAAADPNIDRRADIYALGVLGYELLTGRPPFTGPNPQSVLAAQVSKAPTPVAELRPTVPPALAALIMRCLEKRPADRFQSTEEMLPLLEALSTPSGGTTPIATAPYQAAAVTRRRHAIYAAGAALLVAALGWIGWRALGPSPLAIEITNIRQVTREAVPDIHVAISPDGREVAYESGYQGRTHIMVRDVAGGRPVALTADWPGWQLEPRWTRDGREVVFTNARAIGGRADGQWKVPRLGGPATVPDSTDFAAWRGGVNVARREDTVVVHRDDGSEVSTYLGRNAHSLAWRSDGSAVAYVVGNWTYLWTWGNIAPSVIWVATVGGTPVRVTDTTSLNMSPAWLPDGTLLFVSNRDGPRDIYAVRVDRSGAPREDPVRLTTGLEPYSVSVSADGATAAYDRFILRRNIYAMPIPRAGAVSVHDARPITTQNQTIENLDLSADGRWLAFDSNLDGRQDIYVMPAAGGEPQRVTRDPGDDFAPDFSPDGREIAFFSTRHGTRDIYVINRDGSDERRLTSDPGESYGPAFSPDGLRIAYYNLVPESSTVEVLRRDALDAPWQGPERTPLFHGFNPRWSPDGSALVAYDLQSALSGSGGGAIWVYPLGGARRTLIAGGTGGLWVPLWPEWSADGTRIYFRAWDADRVEGLYEVSASGGAPRLVVRLDEPSMPVQGGSVVAGNGLFYFAVGEMESDVYVMDLVRR